MSKRRRDARKAGSGSTGAPASAPPRSGPMSGYGAAPTQAIVSQLQEAAALHRQGQLAQAERLYLAILQADGNEFNALNLLGVLRHQQGRFDEALSLMQRALARNPGSAGTLCHLGVTLTTLKRHDEAIASFRRAIELSPGLAEAHSNLGLALNDCGRHAEALTSCARAVALRPDFAEAHHNLAVALHHHGRLAEALTSCRNAVHFRPDLVAARWANAMYQVPPVFESEAQIGPTREAFSREVQALDRWFDPQRSATGFAAVGSEQPFLLAYQEENNVALLSGYGDLCARLMQDWYDAEAFPSRDGSAPGPLRVGIVSAHVADHSVWNAIVAGWIHHLDRDRIDLQVIDRGAERNPQASFARARATYRNLAGQGLRGCVDAVHALRPDVLIYPEIGMDPMTTRLASLRLAPVQASAWGHPETTGLPAIDYFLSAGDFEPPEAQSHYRERLVALPRLGTCYSAPATEDPDTARTDDGSDVPVLLCPGSLFKYAPQHDWIFPEIARRLQRCRFVFFAHAAQGASALLRRRIAGAFERAGLDFGDYGEFVPWQTRREFRATLQRADVYLDTIGFSSFNTAMQAVASGILKRLGLPELVAASEQAYVELAVQLARDTTYREHERERIVAARPVLFDDIASVRALEDFLIHAAGRG